MWNIRSFLAVLLLGAFAFIPDLKVCRAISIVFTLVYWAFSIWSIFRHSEAALIKNLIEADQFAESDAEHSRCAVSWAVIQREYTSAGGRLLLLGVAWLPVLLSVTRYSAPIIALIKTSLPSPV